MPFFNLIKHQTVITKTLTAPFRLNATNQTGRGKGRVGWTALHLASYFGHTRTVEALLRAGAKIDVQNDSGDTALHKAAYTGREDIVNLLVAYMADTRVRLSLSLFG